MLSGLCALLPFAPAPVLAQTIELPKVAAGNPAANQHPDGFAEVYQRTIPATLESRLPEVIAAAKVRTGDMDIAHDAVLTQLEHVLGIDRTQLLNFCRIVGEAGIRPWRMGDRLADVVRRHRKLIVRLEAWSRHLIMAEDARIHLLETLKAGNLEHAYTLLEQAGFRNPPLAQSQPRVAAAMIHGLRGEIARARLIYRQSADHFREAADLLPSDRAAWRWLYLESAAHALASQGIEHGDIEALARSVEQYRAVALAKSRDEEPQAWSAAQHNLGMVLLVCGVMEQSTSLVEESVDAFRAALLMRTRARVPLLWAATQQNLGHALSGLGRMTGDMSRVRQAAALYRAALEEISRESSPREWAESQRAVGLAMLDLGRWQQDAGLLDEAVESLRAALEEIARDSAPRTWALTQYHLGQAYYSSGVLRNDPRAMELAVQSFGAALSEQVRERDPSGWATTEASRGAALTVQGFWEPGTARLEQAVEALQSSLTVRERERMPLAWARTKANLGIALRGLALRRGKGSLLEEAVDVTRDARDVFMEAGMVHYEAYFTDRLVDWEAELAALGNQAAAGAP
jgi:tetratricopeptide (TPR) repeat protein